MSRMERMTLEGFRQLLDAHGAQEAHWPRQARDAARALLRHDARARALLEEARALEALLSDTAVPPDGDDLQQRILAVAGIGARERVMPAAANDNGATPWWMAAPLAASLLLGVWLGVSGALRPVQEVLLAQADDPVLEAIMPVEDGEGGLL